jgi:hypothetical protein
MCDKNMLREKKKNLLVGTVLVLEVHDFLVGEAVAGHVVMNAKKSFVMRRSRQKKK